MVCASSPSSFHDSLIKHHVFISFRGEDTRRNFVAYLLKELRRENIRAFEEEDIERGEEISSSLVRAIKESPISIVVFSENYASSSWCLDELEKIIECKNENDQIVLPVFYEVDPSDVRHQKGAYQNAFAEHEKSQGKASKVKNWRSALKTAAGISGYDLSGSRDYTKFTDKIVERVKGVLSGLKEIHSSPGESKGLVVTNLKGPDVNYQHDVSLLKVNRHPNPVESKGLVGIIQHLDRIRSFLEMESTEVRILGICGTSGIGKTTIAQVAYDEFSSRYEGRCFLHNVREESEKHRLEDLSHKLISELHKEKPTPVQERSIRERYFFVVLDDVGTPEQLKHLVTEGICWGPGSRVIVTSKNEQVLAAAGVRHDKHEVKPLDDEKSLELFSLNAFKKSHPERGYEKLSKRVVSYAMGLPLTLKVLGLCLYFRDIGTWESTLRKLDEMHFSPPRSHDVLKIIYDGLDGGQRKRFLDIFILLYASESKDKVMSLQVANGIFGADRIKGLLDKALISVSNDNMIQMPDLIQEMGRDVYQEQHKNSELNQRWCYLNMLYALADSLDSSADKSKVSRFYSEM